MTWGANISGNTGAASSEENEAAERAIAEALRAAVSGLEGVAGATFTGGTIGTVDLLAAS